jgi:CBS domain containing-hemolysin-like protein
MGLLIFFFFTSICFSFLCSIWEAVILSVTPSYVNRQVQEGTATGKLLQTYKQDIDKPLSAVLTLNTIAHTAGAIGVGAQAGKLFGTSAINLGITSLSYESFIAGAMTLAILILSEIIPKTIGANMWKELAPFTVRSLRILMWVLSPFVWMSQLITKTLKKDKDRSVFSRADFAALTSAGLESGALDKSESKIIQNLLKLEKLTAHDIMTPRTVIVMANENLTLKEFYEKNKPIRNSRIPVYFERSDHITGMVLKDELLEHLAEDKHETRLKDIRRDIPFVNDTDVLPTLLDTFVSKRQHIAIVNDDYGSVVGLVTMEDLFETLLGLEIVDETDSVEDLQRLARKQWEERANKQKTVE